MKDFLNRLHARVGDLWWYSAMIFVACRSGDVIQAFIGLWLVPKYVGPNELGAVLPLQQLASLFTVPLAIVAVVFSKYVNTYATRGEYGKVKSFIHDVILISAALFLVCIAAAYILIPHFYERLNVSAGSLTVLVLAAGFAGNISSLFSSALQGLKKFKTMTVQNLISAPIRLVTLLVAMPIRALSGYILGQTTPPASCSLLAAYSLHKDLKRFPTDTSWRKDLPEIGRYLLPIAIYMSISTLLGAISSTIYRQRLPEIESSAYYVLTRFAEITGYVGASISIILVPLASEAHERGKENTSLLTKSLLTSTVTTIALTLVLIFSAVPLINLSPVWSHYADFAHLLPLMALITGSSTIITTIVSYEMACRRITASAIALGISAIWTIALVVITGFDFFRGLIPDALVDQVIGLHFNTLQNITIGTLVANLLQIVIILLFSRRTTKNGFSRKRLDPTHS